MLLRTKTVDGFINELLSCTGWSLDNDMSIQKTDYYLFGSKGKTSFVIHPYLEPARKVIHLYMSDKGDNPVSNDVIEKITQFFGFEPSPYQPKTYSGCCETMSGFDVFLFIWD